MLFPEAGYMIMLSSILNFAINEEMIERNPCRGLRVIDPVKKRDKRLPFSDEQLGIIFNSAIYRTEIEAHRHTAKFWVSLISLFTGMRLNEISGA
jgi:integrase